VARRTRRFRFAPATRNRGAGLFTQADLSTGESQETAMMGINNGMPLDMNPDDGPLPLGAKVQYTARDENDKPVPPPGTSPRDAGMIPADQPNLYKNNDGNYYFRREDGSYLQVPEEENEKPVDHNAPPPESAPPAGEAKQPDPNWDKNGDGMPSAGETPAGSQVPYVASEWLVAVPPPGVTPAEAGLVPLRGNQYIHEPTGYFYIQNEDGTYTFAGHKSQPEPKGGGGIQD
jgi:hypothetical protein